MVSAMGQQEMVVESIQAGAKDFIVKPFQPQRVTETVARLMK
jgi:two-component system chemotaxis response regulator CheY